MYPVHSNNGMKYVHFPLQPPLFHGLEVLVSQNKRYFETIIINVQKVGSKESLCSPSL